MDMTSTGQDDWSGDRGATLLSFSATSLKDPAYEASNFRGTLHYSPIMHQTVMRKSPKAPNIFDKLEFCYCTQRDLQTRRKNPKSTEARHARALATHPKAFHFRKDCLREWKLDIPEVRRKARINKTSAVLKLSEAALLRESKETQDQISSFEASLPTSINGIKENDNKIAVTTKRGKRRSKTRTKTGDQISSRIHFNHTGGIGTTALTPRSIRKVASLF